MRNYLMTLLIGALLIAHTGYADDAEQGEAEQEPTVVGTWLLVGVTYDGEAVEDDDIGDRVIVLDDEGRMFAYVNREAYEEGVADDSGWYFLNDAGDLVVQEDRNRDGELDKEEQEEVDVYSLSWDEASLIISYTEANDDDVITATLAPFEE